MWLEGAGEKGGEGEGDGENMYFWLPGPTLIGSGEGGVGGDDVGDGSDFFSPSSSIEIFPLHAN